MVLPAHWVNGQLDGRLAVSDRGFSYGDGLFETFRCQGGRVHLWPLHLERLRQGLSLLGIECPNSRIEEQLHIGLGFLRDQGIEQAAGRLAISRGEGQRGYGGATGAATVALSLSEVNPWRQPAAPLEVMICRTRLANQPSLAGIKHSNRLEQVLAAREVLARGVDEGLQMNAQGELVCAVAGNLFLVMADKLLTPPIDDCGVAGTVRRLIIEALAPTAGIPVEQRAIGPQLLAEADELFLTNSIAGIRSVSGCDQHRFTSTEWGDTLRSSFYTWSENS